MMNGFTHRHFPQRWSCGKDVYDWLVGSPSQGLTFQAALGESKGVNPSWQCHCSTVSCSQGFNDYELVTFGKEVWSTVVA